MIRLWICGKNDSSPIIIIEFCRYMIYSLVKNKSHSLAFVLIKFRFWRSNLQSNNKIRHVQNMCQLLEWLTDLSTRFCWIRMFATIFSWFLVLWRIILLKQHCNYSTSTHLKSPDNEVQRSFCSITPPFHFRLLWNSFDKMYQTRFQLTIIMCCLQDLWAGRQCRVTCKWIWTRT